MSQADVDLKGNHNFIILKDLNDAIAVPRTNLAAVDMTAANGIAVSGNTLSIDLASPADVAVGVTGKLINAYTLKNVLSSYLLYITVDVSPASDDVVMP